jgi:hypothetical protein
VTSKGSSTQTSSSPSTSNAGSNASSSSASSASASASATVNLTTQQKTEIRQTIINNNSAPRVSDVNFNIGVGTAVPASVRFAPLPNTIVSIQPAWRGYNYFVYQEEIVIVDPRSRKIIAVVRV